MESTEQCIDALEKRVAALALVVQGRQGADLTVRKYMQYELADAEVITNGELFITEKEIEIAGKILAALEGLNIVLAQTMLEKCKMAVMQTKFTV